jgi:hypothetical protein
LAVATTLTRYQVTETPALAAALRAAQAAWPEERRTSRLIERLATVGASALAKDPQVSQAAGQLGLDELARTLQWVEPVNYLDDLRAGWDE